MYPITFTSCTNHPNGSYLLSGIPATAVNSVLLQLQEDGCHIVGWGMFNIRAGTQTIAVLELQPSFAQIFNLAGQFEAPVSNKPLVFDDSGVLIQAGKLPEYNWIVQGKYCSLQKLSF